MTLHTSDGCTIDSSGFTGTLLTSNCFVNAPGQANNAGCGIQSPDSNSYGAGFNSNSGGVYATEWTSDHIPLISRLGIQIRVHGAHLQHDLQGTATLSPTSQICRLSLISRFAGTGQGMSGKAVLALRWVAALIMCRTIQRHLRMLTGILILLGFIRIRRLRRGMRLRGGRRQVLKVFRGSR